MESLQLSGAKGHVVRCKMNELDEVLYRKEMLWLQRSCITWLKEGKRDTKYIHRRVVWRARRNYIQRLRKDDGTWCSTPSDMELMATSYFKEVYTKDPTLSRGEVLDWNEEKVTAEMNTLMRTFY